MFLISKFTLSIHFKTKLGLRYCSRACICFSPQHTASWQYCNITGLQGCHNITAAMTNSLSARTLCKQLHDRANHQSPTALFHFIFHPYRNSPRLQQLLSGSAYTVLVIYFTESSPYFGSLRKAHILYLVCISIKTQALNVNIKECCQH